MSTNFRRPPYDMIEALLRRGFFMLCYHPAMTRLAGLLGFLILIFMAYYSVSVNGDWGPAILFGLLAVIALGYVTDPDAMP